MLLAEEINCRKASLCIGRPKRRCTRSIERFDVNGRRSDCWSDNKNAPELIAEADRLAGPGGAAKFGGNAIWRLDLVIKTLPSGREAISPFTTCPSRKPKDLASGGSRRNE